MTFDSVPLPPLRFARIALLALGGWLVIAAAATLVLEPTRRVVVIAPGEMTALGAVAGAEVDLADRSALGPIVEGQGAGFVARLYAGGAWLVLPALAGGCRGAPPARVAASAK
jgi:hypothetical protein